LGIRRIDHIQYFDSVVKELLKKDDRLYIAFDSNFLIENSLQLTLDCVKKNFNWNISEGFLLQKPSFRIRKMKNILGCLIYLSDLSLEWKYFLRHCKRSKLNLFEYMFMLSLKFFPARLRISISRNLVNRIRIKLSNTKISNHFISQLNLDLVYISPGNMFNSLEDQLVSEANNLSIPTAIQTLSWDNLNSKGSVGSVPTIYLVWNEMHKQLLINRHGIPIENIRVTGSIIQQKYAYTKSLYTREQVFRYLGIPPHLKILIYLGSSLNVCIDESIFLRKLIESDPDVLESVFIIIRPHPANFEIWEDWFSPNTLVWPKNQPLDLRSTEETQSLLKAAIGAIGINTSGFLDALSCDTPIVAVRNNSAIFQESTTHFMNLIQNGLPVVNRLKEAISIFENPTNKKCFQELTEITLPFRDSATIRTVTELDKIIQNATKDLND
jgi:uncharacterized protein (DUF1778 family)